jgi:hypothetical protein
MHYTRDVEHFLIPHIGHLTLGNLTLRQLNMAFTQIAATRNRNGQPQTACTLQHVHTTLRAPLSAAVREGLIVDNPAGGSNYPPAHARMPGVDRSPRRRMASHRAAPHRRGLDAYPVDQLSRLRL